MCSVTTAALRFFILASVSFRRGAAKTNIKLIHYGQGLKCRLAPIAGRLAPMLRQAAGVLDLNESFLLCLGCAVSRLQILRKS